MHSSASCICIPSPEDPFWLSCKVECSCGEDDESMSSLTCAQHSKDCAIMVAYRKFNAEEYGAF